MAVAEEVGIRVALLGRPEFTAAMNSVRQAMTGFGDSNKAAAATSKAMADSTEAQRAAMGTLRESVAASIEAQREYEAALVQVSAMEDEAAASAVRFSAAEREAGAARVEAARAARDASLSEVTAAREAAEEEIALADRTKVANAEKMSSYEALKASSLGSMLGLKQASVGVAESEAATAAQIEQSNARKVASFDALGSHVGLIGVGMIGVAGAVGGATIKMAADFESQTTRLVTSAGETRQGLDGVKNGILDMAGQVGYSTTQLADAMYKVESGGQHGAAGLEVLKAAAQGAKAENADLTTVSDALTSALTDYHLPASAAADVTSKLVAATASGKMTFEELAGSMSAILPVASAAHISLNDILADEASMTLHGMSAQQASQNLADAVRHLQAPTGTMIDSFSRLGLSAQQISQDLGKQGLSGTVNEISNAITSKMGGDTTRVVLDLKTAFQNAAPPVQDLGNKLLSGSISYKDFVTASKALPPELRGQVSQINSMANATHKLGSGQATGAQILSTYAAQMRGAMGDATGMNVALMIGGENAKNTAGAYQAISGASADAAGNVKGWDEIQGTFNQKMSEAKAGMGAFAISIGQDLMPVATAILGPLAAFARFLTEHRSLAIAVASILVGTLAAGLALVTLWLYNAATGVGTMDIALLGLEGVPVVAVIGAIVAVLTLLATGLTLAYQRSQTFRDIVGGAFNAVKAVVGGIIDGIVGALHALGDALDWARQHWQLLVVLLSPILVPLGLITLSLASQAVGFIATAGASAVYRGAQALAAAVTWASSTANWASAASLAGQAVKWVAATIAGNAYALASKAWAAAQWVLNLAMDANPVGLLVIGILAAAAAITYAVTHWAEITDWLNRHKAVAIALGVVIGTILVVAIWAMSEAIWGAVTAVGGLTIALLANPITWIVLAIVAAVALLAFGIYELVTHWDTVWHAMGTAVSWFYSNVLTPIGHFFKAVFDGIITVVKVAGAVIFTILVAPWVLAFNLLKDPILALWHSVLEPAFKAIGSLFRWLYDNVVKWFTDQWNAEIRGWGVVFNWFHDNVVKPVSNAIAAVLHWLHDNVVKPVSDLINAQVRGMGIVYQWLYDNVWQPVSNAVSSVFHWLYDNTIKPVGDLINWIIKGIGAQWQWFHDNIWVPVTNAVASVFHWLYDNVIKPVGDAINSVVHSIGQAFSDTVDWIKRTWQTVQDIVSIPVRFVVNTIYGKGIKPTWDAIAGVFGLPQAPPAPAFAGGGIVGDDAQHGPSTRAALGRVMPGYEPGHDRYHIMVGGGEAIMRPEWTRMMLRTFGPSAIHAMNAEASAGRHPMFGVGGGGGRQTLGSYWGNEAAKRRGPLAGGVHDSPFAGQFAAGGIAGGGSGPDLPIPPLPPAGPENLSLGDTILKSFSNLLMIPQLFTDPKGYFDGIFKPFVDPLNGMGGSRFMQSMKDVPAKAIDGIVQKVKDWISSMMSGGASIGPESASHAADIVAAAHAKGLHHDAAVIAIMTGLQESGLRVLANPNVPASMALPHDGVGQDHDSVGIFQQRQSWGPTPLLMNPFGSAELFYNRLGGGPYGDFGAAAQRVQVSAFPGAYSKWQGQATGLAGPNFASGGIVGVSGGLPFGGFRALGGDVSPGSAYMVGENGPELVAPSSPGTVIPADLTAALGDASGSRPDGLGLGGRGDVHFHAGAIVVQGAIDPAATAQAVADQVSDKIARQ